MRNHILKSMTSFMLLAVMTTCLTGCPVDPEQESRRGRMTYFIGIDVSGSFRAKPEFKDACKFLAHYIYAHIHNLGGLKKPKALFVSSIGGDYKDDPQVFRTIFDFQNQSIAGIEKSLLAWYGEKDRLTDFNTFFKSVATQVKKRNLILSPVTVIIVSDGIPEGVKIRKGKKGKASYSKIKLDPMEYLARNVTVRLLYAAPKVGKNWEDFVTRRRVRLWIAPKEVMKGWKKQLVSGKPIEEQEKFFEWVKYNVDYRVRVKRF